MALTSQVPQLKRCLEKIIFQTKVVLDAHHVGSTFTCGVLKTKNLDGAAREATEGLGGLTFCGRFYILVH